MREPLIYGAKLDISSSVTPGLTVALLKAKTLVDAVGPALSDTQALGSLLGLQHSVQVAGRLLELWHQKLTGRERSLLMDYGNRKARPDPADPFPDIFLSPGLGQLTGPLLAHTHPGKLTMNKADKRTWYFNCVKSIHKAGLCNRRGEEKAGAPDRVVMRRPTCVGLPRAVTVAAGGRVKAHVPRSSMLSDMEGLCGVLVLFIFGYGYEEERSRVSFGISPDSSRDGAFDRAQGGPLNAVYRGSPRSSAIARGPEKVLGGRCAAEGHNPDDLDLNKQTWEDGDETGGQIFLGSEM
ncbi:hypothetical protein N1851_028039 [Merluccius polli]|uniref:Uncharacterized protein n=1 Tax=Merluccius polli TaxID=89951 RepID=A0AA47NSY9_MERPO|nr:hypothetical protein N1851_028039 [Merluccius polli]